MLTVLCELAAAKARPLETEIVFVGLIDEEHAQAGSRALAASKFKADLAIVGEPTKLLLATSELLSSVSTNVSPQAFRCPS